MLSLKNRLRARGDFNRTYQRGQTRHGQFVLVRAQANRRPNSRFGIVVSKKISKSAVTRNRIKRRISEVVRTSGLLDSGHDVVIVAKAPIIESSPSALKQDIMNTIRALVR